MGLSNTKLSNRLFSLLWKGRYRDFVIFSLLLLVFFMMQSWLDQTGTTSQTVQTSTLSESEVLVSRVLDGDTFAYEKDGQEQKVRMAGINTPETKDPRYEVQCFGQEASDKTTEMIAGRPVKLVKDKLGSNIDLYGREIRLVYLADGTLLNRFLVENGYAFAETDYSFSLKDEFVNLEKEAKIAQRGLWSPQACN
jgi:micrococcal nuclease